MINIGSLVGTLELQDNATSKLADFAKNVNNFAVGFDQALNRTFGPFAQFHKHVGIVGMGLQSLGLQMTRTGDRLTLLSAGLIATGASSVKLATEFQTSMMKIANLTDIGTQGVGKMRDAVLQMGPELAQGPIQLSDALYSIGSVGLTGAKALETLEVSAKGTAIGLGETKDVAKAVSAAVINYAHDNMTATRAADVLTVAVKAGGAEADEFARSLGRVIATGRQVGVSFEETTASIATFTRLGVRADEAATALRGTFAFLMKPAAGVVAQLEKLGLSMDDIRKSVKERGLAQTLIDLVKITGDNEEVIGKIIPNVRALAGVLANAGSQAEEYKNIVAQVSNANGALDESFKRVSETAGFKFEQALARLQVLGIRLGDTLLPVLVDLAESLTPFIDMLTKMVSAFNDLPGPIKTATFMLVGFGLALGPIMGIMGRLTESFAFVTRGFTGFMAYIRPATQSAEEYAIALEKSFRLANAFRAFQERHAPPAPKGPVTPSVVEPITTQTMPSIVMDETKGPSFAFGELASGARIKVEQRAARGFGVIDNVIDDVSRLTTHYVQAIQKIPGQLLLAEKGITDFVNHAAVIKDTTVLFDKPVVSVGKFELALEQAGKTLTSEVFNGNREILRLTGSIEALPGGIVNVTNSVEELGRATFESSKALASWIRESNKLRPARFLVSSEGVRDTSIAVDFLENGFTKTAKAAQEAEVAVAGATSKVAEFVKVGRAFSIETLTGFAAGLGSAFKGTFTTSVATATELLVKLASFLRGGFVSALTIGRDALLAFGKVLAMFYVGGLALAIDGVIRFGNAVASVPRVVSNTTKLITDAFSRAGAAYSRGFESFTTGSATIPEAVARPFAAVSRGITDSAKAITDVFARASNAYRLGFEKFTTGSATVPESLSRPFTAITTAIRNFSSSLTRTLAEAGTAYSRWFTEFTTGTATIPEVISKPFTATTRIVTEFGSSLSRGLSGSAKAFDDWYTRFTTTPARIPELLSRPLETAADGVSKASKSLVQSFKDLFTWYDRLYTKFATESIIKIKAPSVSVAVEGIEESVASVAKLTPEVERAAVALGHLGQAAGETGKVATAFREFEHLSPEDLTGKISQFEDYVARLNRLISFKPGPDLLADQQRLLTSYTEHLNALLEEQAIRARGVASALEETGAAVRSIGEGATDAARSASALGKVGEAAAEAAPKVGELGESTALVLRSTMSLTESTSTASRSIEGMTSIIGKATPALFGFGGRLLAVFNALGDVALGAELTVRAIAFVTDTTDLLNYAIEKSLGAIGVWIGAFKDLVYIGGRELVNAFNSVIEAITGLRDAIGGSTIVQALAAGFTNELAKILLLVEYLEAAADRIAELARKPITTEGVIAEGAGLMKPMAGYVGPQLGDSAKIRALKADFGELMNVYNELVDRPDPKIIAILNELGLEMIETGRRFSLTAETADVLAEKFKKIKDAGIQIPKEIEILIKVRSISPGNEQQPELQTMQDFVAGARRSVEQAQMLAGHDLEDMVVNYKEAVAKANAELKKLAITHPKELENLKFAIAKPEQFGGLDRIIKDFGVFFSSADIATIAIKGLAGATKDSMKEMERDTRWITTFSQGARDLDKELKSAFAEGVPIDVILEEWGNKAQHTQNRIVALGSALKDIPKAGTLTQFVAESQDVLEANKPFEDIQKNADKLNRQVGIMMGNGRTIAQIYDLMGDSAVKAGEQAVAMGGDVRVNLETLKQEADRIKLDQVFARVTQEINEFQRNIAKTPATVAELAELNAMGERWAETARERIAAIKAMKLGEVEQAIAIRNVTDELNLQFQAYKSNMNAIRDSQHAIEDMLRAFEPDTLQTSLDDVSIKFQRIRDNMTQAEKEADNYGARMTALAAEEITERNNVAQAWLRHGAQTRANLAALAKDATAQYIAMRDSGLFAAKDIAEAWNRMVEANILAQDQWSGEFMKMVASLPDVLGKAFSEMMLQAKTFKEFFVGIWESIKNSVLNVFAEIVDTFISQTLKKMLAGILGAKGATGSQNPLTSALGGLLGGGLGKTAGAGEAAGVVGSIDDFSGAGLEPMLGGGATAGVAAAGKGGLLSAGTTNWAAVAGGGLLALAGGDVWRKAGESKFQNAMGGAMTGAGIGTMIMPGVGTAVGAGIGAIVGLISAGFRKSENQKIMEEIGHGLGVDISDGLAKEIEELAKTIEGGTKNQRRAIAEILSLDKIIEEGGGLSQKNVRTYEQAAMELFGVIERGGNTGKLAVDQLNTLVGKFAAQADATGGVWDKNFQAIIARAKETGVELSNLTAAIDAQMSKLVSGLNKLTASFEAETKKAFIGAFADLPGGKDIGDKIWDALGDPDKMKEALKGLEDDFVKVFESTFKNVPQLDDAAEKLWAVIFNPAELEKQIDKLDLKPEIEKKLREFLTPFNVFKLDPAALEQMKNDFFKQFKEKFSDIPEVDKIAEKLWAVIGNPKELERAIDRLDLAPAVEKKLREFLGAFDPSKLPTVASAAAQAQFDRLSRIAFASFNAIVAQGKTAVEAIDEIGDSVDRLISIHDKLKLKGGAAYEALARFRNLVKDNRELVDSAIGLNDAMVALTNLGGMTEDIFKDLQLEGQGIFERLTAAGFTSEEALKMMAPFLQNVVKIAKEYGFSIDEATQKLIDQADAAGALDKKMMSTNDILMTGFIAIIQALGGPLPDAFKEFAEKAKKEADNVSKALDDMARPRHISVTIDPVTGEEIPEPGGSTEPGEPGPEGEPRPPTYDVGGIVGARKIIPFPNLMGGDYLRPRGDDSIPALLSPGEMVLTESDQNQLLSLIRNATAQSPETTPPAGFVMNFEEGAFSGMLSGAIIDSPERARELAYAIVTEFEKRGKLWNKARNSLGISKAS